VLVLAAATAAAPLSLIAVAIKHAPILLLAAAVNAHMDNTQYDTSSDGSDTKLFLIVCSSYLLINVHASISSI
jgi:hypothetical protein